MLLRTVLDQVTGDLSDTRTRYIGSRPVKLFRVTMQGGEAVLAMSSRTWITYYYQNRQVLLIFMLTHSCNDDDIKSKDDVYESWINQLKSSSLWDREGSMSVRLTKQRLLRRFHLTPLSYETLEYAAGFSSEQCPEGIVAISTNTLR